jgi:outer membrane protein assembly factor BamB
MQRDVLRPHALSLICAFVVLAFYGTARAGDWPGWRGPTGCGYADEKDLPLAWDGKTGEGVLWKASLKATTGHSSPIVWGDRMFITTAEAQTPEQQKNREIPEHHFACYQASDGKLLWRTRVPHGPHPQRFCIYAVPTPVTDGKAVYCWFGSGVIAAVDFDGKLLWRHERGDDSWHVPDKPMFMPGGGPASSTVLYQDTVILLAEPKEGKGFLQALDKKTGEVKWEQKRPKGNWGSYGNNTPLLADVKGKPQLIVLAPFVLQGLNPADGTPIWWCTAAGFCCSPIHVSGLIYADKDNGPALLADATGVGDVTATHMKWQLPKVAGQFSSAVVSGEYLYRLSPPGVITCRKLASGEEVYKERLEKVNTHPSPIATADGRIYLVSTTVSHVVKAGPKFEVLGGGNLGGQPGNGSSPAVANGRIFVRDFNFLYCLGKK